MGRKKTISENHPFLQKNPPHLPNQRKTMFRCTRLIRPGMISRRIPPTRMDPLRVHRRWFCGPSNAPKLGSVPEGPTYSLMPTWMWFYGCGLIVYGIQKDITLKRVTTIPSGSDSD